MSVTPDQFCTACGTPRVAEGRFCGGCGHAFASDAAGDADQARVDAPLRAAQVHLSAGDAPGAAVVLRAAIEQRPHWAEALALLGVAELRQYHLAVAWALLDRAIHLAPDSIFVRLRLAEYWLALGVTPRAVMEIEQALLAADDEQAGYLRAYLRRIAVMSKGAFSRGGQQRSRIAPLGA